MLPASALIFGEKGMQVAVLTKDNHVSLRKVELGRELGLEVGSVASAVVKATNVHVETPRGRS